MEVEMVNAISAPLKCGGADDPPNMQWPTTAEAKAKDRIEERDSYDRRRRFQTLSPIRFVFRVALSFYRMAACRLAISPAAATVVAWPSMWLNSQRLIQK